MIRFDWLTNSEGSNRLVMVGVGAVVITVILGTMILLSNLLDQKTKQEVGIITPTSEVVKTTQTTSAPTATTTKGGLTLEQLQHPESSQLTDEQLAYQFNQTNSGLTSATYEKAKDFATKFIIADVTGKGASNYSDYYKTTPNDPWLRDIKLTYVAVVTTDDPKVIKAVAWYGGHRTKDGKEVVQVKHGFYIKRENVNSLEFQPYYPTGIPDDREFGITFLY